MSSHSKRKHAFCGASTASRWMKCPGSLYLGFGIRTPVKSYTVEGTRGHELAEKMLHEWLRTGTLSDEYIRDRVLEYKDTEEPDEWRPGVRRKNMALYCAEYIDAVKDELTMFSGKPNILVEKQLDLDHDLNMFGTLDFFATGPVAAGINKSTDPPSHAGLIVDFKYGVGVQVVASENWQLAYYACMLAKNSKFNLAGVRVAICQPRAEIKRSSVWFSAEELVDRATALRNGAIRAIYQAAVREPELHAGEHCRFCPAKNTCSEYAELSPPKAEPVAVSNEIPTDCETPAFTDLE